MYIFLMFALTLYIHVIPTFSQCHNNCNKNGDCDFWGRCRCFEGFEGFDCSSRKCPFGKLLVDTPHGNNLAHKNSECSGKGVCIKSTGECKCFQGYYGRDCGKTLCPNNCNNNGKCMSLKESASLYDGYRLNYSSTYNLWDGELIYGCVCEAGWSGYDCSERSCGVGVDPRTAVSSSHEQVTLVCSCSGSLATTCAGSFKFTFLGYVIEKSFSAFNTFSGTISGTVLTVNSILSGSLAPGQTISGTGITSGTKIVSQLTFSSANVKGGTGTYSVSASNTVTDITITSYTIASQIADAFKTAPVFFGPDHPGISFLTATSQSASAVSSTGAGNTASTSNSICAASQSTITLISFQRQSFDMPSISFYQNSMPAGVLFFQVIDISQIYTIISIFVIIKTKQPYLQTSQDLVCVCSPSCSGTFLISFDGEMTSKMTYSDSASSVVTKLNSLRTINSALAVVSLQSASVPVCTSGATTRTTILIKAPAGNMPRPNICKSNHPIRFFLHIHP